MPLAVCRIQKIKTWGLLKGNEAHTTRQRETPNANPEATNVQVVGNSDNLDLATLVRNKIGEQKIRSNAVLAVEILLSASPGYFRPDKPGSAGTYDQQRLNDFVLATVGWLQSSWGERVVRAELHLDEITPHIHAYIVPLDERGKLNCRALFGGRDKLSQLQDSFASAVAHLGISRGVKGSTANYTSLKKYYAAVNQDSQILSLENCLVQPQNHETAQSYRERIIEILTPQFEIINHQLRDRVSLQAQKFQLQQTANRSEQRRQQLERELQFLLATSKQQEFSLELVAYELGLNQDKRDPKKWHSTHCTIYISDSCFYDPLHNRHSKNALDLVMHVNKSTFDVALVWLRDRFGEEGMLAAVTDHARTKALAIPPSKFVPPTPDECRWREVENYLTSGCCIPQKLVQTLHARGFVYADTTGQVVFLARNLSQEVTGAYLHAPGDKDNAFSLYPLSQRSRGWFHLSMGGSQDATITKAMLVSSPIEALSLAVLNAPHKHKTLYLVIDSDRAPIPVEFLQNVPSVVVAMPVKTAMKVCKTLQSTTKLEPNTSWNEQLQGLQPKNDIRQLAVGSD